MHQFSEQWANNTVVGEYSVEYVNSAEKLSDLSNIFYDRLTTTAEMIDEQSVQLYQIRNTETDTILGFVELLRVDDEYFGCDPTWRFGNVDIQEWQCVKTWAITNGLPSELITSRLEYAVECANGTFDE